MEVNFKIDKIMRGLFICMLFIATYCADVTVTWSALISYKLVHKTAGKN